MDAERELMESLAVGRSTVREVIRQLQALGIVESRRGSGTYLLRSVSADTIHVPLSINTTHLRDALLQTLVAFVGFCLAASGTYFLNDANDAEAEALREPFPVAAVAETAQCLGTEHHGRQ